MAATGNEAVLLKQLKSYNDEKVQPALDAKLNAPSSAGTDGQMLVYGASGNQWIDVPKGTAYSADNMTLQLSGTQFSVKDLGITAAKIANGTITSGKLASGVIPDVSGFITETDADEAYAAKSHTHTSATASAPGFMSAADKTKLNGIAANANNYVLPAASTAAIGGVKTVSDADFNAYLGIS